MRRSLLKWFVAVGAVLAMLMAGNAWADGHGKGHHGHHGHHVYHHAPKYVHHHVHHYRPPVVHHYYAPVPVVQHHTYYVPAPVPVYVAPPPPPPGFAFSATINEPGFSLGIAAGN